MEQLSPAHDVVATVKPRDCKDNKLLLFVGQAYETTKEFCKQPRADLSAGERGGLSDLSTLLYELFVGIPLIKDGFIPNTSTADLCSSNTPETSTADPCSSNMLSSAEGTLSRKQEKRAKSKTSHKKYYTTLMDLGLPSSVCDLLSNLMDTEDNSECYNTAEEVEADLCLMLTHPDHFLFDCCNQQCTKLNFPSGKLYGRTVHMSKFIEAYNHAMEPGRSCGIILVSGCSGSGKSSLVWQMRGSLIEKGGCFVAGKFDERQVQPLSVVIAALNKIFNVLLEREIDCLDEIRASIKDAVGNDCKELTHLIPDLSRVIGKPTAVSAQVQGKEAQNRLKYKLQMLLRAVSSPSNPTILFLDDLQWADEESLELIRFLITDAENHSLLLLGCYRDNEVGLDHPLRVKLKEVEQAGVTLTDIKVENIDEDSVNELIADTLHLLPRLTRPLASVLYKNTSGNPLFLVQFLMSLHEKGVLHFSLGLRRWKWDVGAIQSKKIADNVAGLMMDKMFKLAQEVQSGLKVAACFGFQCEESVLELLEGDKSLCQDIVSNLDFAVSEGLMVKTGTLYQFSHDQIQQAAYSLTPERDRGNLHLKIGSLIWRRMSDEELEGAIFVVVDHLNRGAKLIMDHCEKVEVARLNLIAGKKAISASSFSSALIYFLEGIGFLGEDSWESNYELSLQLFTHCVETQYVTGNFSMIMGMLTSIFSHARCVNDRLCAYYTLINTLGAQNKALVAVGIGLDVLTLLGESFPDEINQPVIKDELLITLDLLEGTTMERILQKDEMQDKSKIAAMRFLSLIIIYTFVVRQELFPLVAFRMVQLTLSHGVCKESAFGFATFGMVLSCSLGDFHRGHQFGKLALSLLDRFKATESLPRLYCIVYAFINNWVEPIQASLDMFSNAFEVGMSTGDLQWATANANVFTSCAFICGCKLEPLAEKVGAYIKQMKDFRQNLSLYGALPYYQAIYNLMSCSDDPTKLTGDFMDQDEVLKIAMEMENWNAVWHIYFVCMKLCLLFGSYDLAAEVAEKRKEIRMFSHQNLRGAIIADDIFYTGLLAFTLARTKKHLKWRLVAKNAVKTFGDLAKCSSWNFQHKLDLLDAECAFLDQDIEKAAVAYDRSIHIAGRHGFVHEQALACERAAIFSLEIGNNITATEYYDRSLKLYLQWGARRKADDILAKLQ